MDPRYEGDCTALLTVSHPHTVGPNPPHVQLLARYLQQAEGVHISRQDFRPEETVYTITFEADLDSDSL